MFFAVKQLPPFAIASRLHSAREMGFVRKAAKAALHNAGAIQVFRAVNSAKLRILMYHRFGADTSGLEQQCEFIRKYYHPVSLDEVGAQTLPKNALAITVDDGYRDFLLHGWPVFRRYNLPVTVYLVSGFLNGELWLWVDQVRYLVEASGRCACAEECTRQIDQLHERLQTIPNEERLNEMSKLPGNMGIELPPTAPKEYEPLRWSEVRELAREGVSFGAHTHTHPILSRISDGPGLREEIAGSKEHIERELGLPVRHFCYPNGTTRDIGDRAVQAVREAGFATAVTTEPGLNSRTQDPHLLKRQGVDPWVDSRYFAELLAGVRGHR